METVPYLGKGKKRVLYIKEQSFLLIKALRERRFEEAFVLAETADPTCFFVDDDKLRKKPLDILLETSASGASDFTSEQREVLVSAFASNLLAQDKSLAYLASSHTLLIAIKNGRDKDIPFLCGQIGLEVGSKHLSVLMEIHSDADERMRAAVFPFCKGERVFGSRRDRSVDGRLCARRVGSRRSLNL